MDLFAEFKLLDMGERLGRFIGQYRNAYFQPDKRNGMVIYSYKPLPDAEQRIYDKISDITISMKATDHLTMPEFVSTEYTVQLSEKEREKYNRLKKDLVLSEDSEEVTASNAASLSNKLSQMANGAVYSDDELFLFYCPSLPLGHGDQSVRQGRFETTLSEFRLKKSAMNIVSYHELQLTANVHEYT